VVLAEVAVLQEHQEKEFVTNMITLLVVLQL
jgi:hypothetical protein